MNCFKSCFKQHHHCPLDF
uniref:Uncharacterized protein n=1 Tax=Anguilla anguilla TaxID=7936 RepID=A0A0E9S6D5_ANGAN